MKVDESYITENIYWHPSLQLYALLFWLLWKHLFYNHKVPWYSTDDM